MINYDLAKKLKDAGFPQVIWSGQSYWEIHSQKEPVALMAERFMENEAIGDKVKIPTLSELIEACGDRFFSLFQCKGHAGNGHCWKADAEDSMGRVTIAAFDHPTPEEAVANLWLKLHE